MGKAILIYNWRVTENETFPKYLADHGIEYRILDNPDDGTHRYSKWYKIVNFLECILLSIRAVCMAGRNDVIVSMCATPGIIASMCNPLHRRILVLNLLCHSSEQPNVAERLRNALYSRALNKPWVWATANTQKDIARYTQMFGLRYQGHLLWLPDGLDLNLHLEDDDCTDDSKPQYDVFACGASARDWRLLSEVAASMPDRSFHVIATESEWKQEYNKPNITVEFQVPHDRYLSALRHANVVALPLKSEVTAGLLVMFDAIKYGKCVVITHTATTEQFVPERLREMLLVGMRDSVSFTQKIATIIDMSEVQRTQIVQQEKSYFEDNYSDKKRNEKIVGILRVLNNGQY